MESRRGIIDNNPIFNDINYSDTEEFPAVGFDYICSSDNAIKSSKLRDKMKKKESPKKLKNSIEKKTRKKGTISRDKIEATIAKKKLKNIQPGECMKFIEINFDEGIRKFDFFGELRGTLESLSIKAHEDSLIVPNTLTWTRIIESYLIDEENEIKTSVNKENEEQILIIWSWDEVAEEMHNKSFVEKLSNIKMITPGKKLLLLIYGIEDYFKYHRENTKKEKLHPMYHRIEEIPKVSRKYFEISLVEIQVLLNCSSILIDNSQDMCSIILNFTKAIAEIPYKLLTRENENEDINFYATGNNKNTVKVDSDGNGLKRLWSKQLCFFNNAGLATAEALCAAYPSPLKLMNAYQNCSTEEGEKLLKDIPIRRAAAALSAGRKIGPELSRKIHVMFTSNDGDQILS